MNNLSLNQLNRLESLKIEALKCQCYANYWVNYATSETNKSRIVNYGGASKEFKGRQLTDTELESDAFGTALSHIGRLEEIQTEIQRVILG